MAVEVALAAVALMMVAVGAGSLQGWQLQQAPHSCGAVLSGHLIPAASLWDLDPLVPPPLL